MNLKQIGYDVAILVGSVGFVWNFIEMLKYKARYGFFARGQDDFRPLYLMMTAAGLGIAAYALL